MMTAANKKKSLLLKFSGKDFFESLSSCYSAPIIFPHFHIIKLLLLDWLLALTPLRLVLMMAIIMHEEVQPIRQVLAHFFIVEPTRQESL